MPTAAILIIGNEILSGKYRDENSPWLAAQLRALGIDLHRIVTLPDDVECIGRTVRELSDRFDHVFTSGGVGPTHDDLTMLGVAQGFGVPLERNPTLERLVRKHLRSPVTPAALRMADVPRGAVLWADGDLRFPQVVVRNVVIFPGVPKLLRLKFEAICHRFAGEPVHSERLTTTDSESAIAGHLTDAQRRWSSVEIGSYPKYDKRPYTVTITLDSRDTAALAEARAFLAAALADHLVDPAGSQGD